MATHLAHLIDVAAIITGWQRLKKAMAAVRWLREAGQLAAAEQICRQVLAANPNVADAWRLLGFIALQQRRADLAAPYLARAVELVPDSAEAANDLGTAFFEQGRLAEAIDFPIVDRWN